MPNYVEVVVGNQFLVLSHYPILSFNSQSNGAICVYGHVHGNLIKNEIGKLYSEARTVEVTVEACPHPITLRELVSKASKEPVSFDHHLVLED